MKFPVAKFDHLDYYKLDHRPILMSLVEEAVQDSNAQGVLRFEACWLKDAKFKEVAQEAWQSLGNA